MRTIRERSKTTSKQGRFKPHGTGIPVPEQSPLFASLTEPRFTFILHEDMPSDALSWDAFRLADQCPTRQLPCVALC